MERGEESYLSKGLQGRPPLRTLKGAPWGAKSENPGLAQAALGGNNLAGDQGLGELG